MFDAFPSYLQPKCSKRKLPAHRQLHVSTSSATATAAGAESAAETPLSPSLPDVPVHVLDYSAVESDTADTPRKKALKRKLTRAEGQLTSYRKRIKLLLQSKRRLTKKNANLKAVIADLRQNSIMSSESLAVLQSSACGVEDLIKRRAAKLSGGTYQVTYSPELRSFALTLFFYSLHAYRYVRKMFDTCLPHPRTIEKWLKVIDGRPGFTSEAFDALRKRTELRPQKQLICALMMDEVAIRQQIEWDGKKFVGYIDMGTGLDDDSMPVAKEALTFMVVGVNDLFKVPVEYFLIDGLGGTERANLVTHCLSRLHDAGVLVVSLTFDGCAANLSMLRNLGCNLDVLSSDFRTCFKHPVSDYDVCVFLDPCHMLKPVRNTLGDNF